MRYRILMIIVILSILVSACNMPTANTPTKNNTPIVDNLLPENDSSQDKETPADPPAPTALSPAAETPTIAVTGPEEIVFDWSEDACEPMDIPDLPARAFRDDSGLVHLISAHILSRANVGPDLNTLTHLCDPIMKSDHNANPAFHNDNEWLAAVYTEDGRTIYGSIHNEYHGWEHSDCTGFEDNLFACWYNTITWAVSTDGGLTFTDALAPPNHFVSGLPHPYEAGAGPYGALEPSNIIKAKDGYYYQIVRFDDFRSDEQWACLMRTNDLANPSTWRGWNGSAFEVVFTDIYADPDAVREDHLCAPLARDQIGAMDQSLTYNTYLKKYVLVGLSADTIDGREVWGIFYSFSDDLINWTPRQLLWERELPWTYLPGDDEVILYPTLIDPDSPSLSFETADKQVYLYYTKTNFGNPLDRDLIRVPVEFFASEAEAIAADARTTLSMFEKEASSETVLVAGDLTAFGGGGLDGKTIEFYAQQNSGDGEYAEYSLSGIIPDGATSALIGYRVNTECSCTGEASEFFLYEFGYYPGNAAENKIPNGDFSRGLSGVNLYLRPDLAELVPSDRGAGNMLHLQAAVGETAAAHLATISVSANDPFTFKIAAKVPPSARSTGVFLIIFLNSSGEIIRYTIDFEPPTILIGTAETDSGNYLFAWETPTDDSALKAVFQGDEFYLPSRASLTVDIP